MAEEKTNVMRILAQKKIPYVPHSYPHREGEAVDGPGVAALLGRPPERVFKTLVTRGSSGAHYVFVLPVCAGLDLKRAARAVGEKGVELLPLRELTPLTGYVRGGCSPIGMKKRLPTVVDASARSWETILVSAGRVGAQVELSPADLAALTGAGFAPVGKEEGDE